MCRIEKWGVRTLRKKINSMLYERTAISKKPDKLIKRVIDVYNDSGLNFIREVKEKISWDKERTTDELLLELEEITPGFLEWGAQLKK